MGGPARRWRVTGPGKEFLAALAAAQVWRWETTWWTRLNWLMAFPWAYGDGEVPSGFTDLTLRSSLALPVGERVAFEPFADRLIQMAPLVWKITDPDSARSILRSLVERVVVGPL